MTNKTSTVIPDLPALPAIKSDPALVGVMPIPDWLCLEGPSTVFSTPSEWDFFRRHHREELARRGGLLLGAGRKPDYATPELGALVREILHRESIKRLPEAAKPETEAVQV